MCNADDDSGNLGSLSISYHRNVVTVFVMLSSSKSLFSDFFCTMKGLEHLFEAKGTYSELGLLHVGEIAKVLRP